jgi:hypothetical protein
MARLLVLFLLKSVKSLQLVLNEFFIKLSDSHQTVTASAFTQARANLSHTAFIELNEKAVLESVYSEKDYKTYLGHRLIAIDGSKSILPNSAPIRQEFGTIRIANQKPETKGEYCGALISVAYDVLNRISITGTIARLKSYEVNLAQEHLVHLNLEDLLIFDRGYASYYFFALLCHENRNFVCRCSKGSFKEVQEMFKSEVLSKIVKLKVPSRQKKKVQEAGLEEEIEIRLVKVVLETGEIEVLATALKDEKKYKTEDFKELYNFRWGVEGFYEVVKSRLNLENFTGKSVESIKQDFYATLFITGVESILTREAQAQLKERKESGQGYGKGSKKGSGNKQEQQVNRAVSFNAIKNNLIELFLEEGDVDKLLEKLTQLFLTKPISEKM